MTTVRHQSAWAAIRARGEHVARNERLRARKRTAEGYTKYSFRQIFGSAQLPFSLAQLVP
jgi:hypothetical protein